MSVIRLAVTIGIALCLASCAPEPQPAKPALWEVSDENGSKAWLFGTIHALERPADWNSGPIDEAMNEADLVLVEIAYLTDTRRGAKIFAELASDPGIGKLTSRLPAEKRPALRKILKKNGMTDDQFERIETWAAALMIAQAETRQLNSEYGIDRAVLAATRDKPVRELEGHNRQLSIFDRLPEGEQVDLLEAVIDSASAQKADPGLLAAAWRNGDMETIHQETDRGMLVDPELREALFTGRNREWTSTIIKSIKQGQHPFVAVGAAHMAGPDGIPSMLMDKGFTVRRVQ